MNKYNSKIITLWVQIRDMYLYFFRHALILNAYVDDHTWCGIRHRNWGDDLNYYFIHLISGRPVVFYHNFWLAKKLHFTNYLCIGTLLDARKLF
jgi:pyruvyltransferase